MKPLFVTLLVAFSVNANAFAVFGSPDCGQWVKAQNATHRAWLLGYLSGMNAVWTKGQSAVGGPLDKLSSAQQAFVWMDNYCQKNPLKDVGDGATGLFLELNER